MNRGDKVYHKTTRNVREVGGVVSDGCETEDQRQIYFDDEYGFDYVDQCDVLPLPDIELDPKGNYDLILAISDLHQRLKQLEDKN